MKNSGQVFLAVYLLANILVFSACSKSGTKATKTVIMVSTLAGTGSPGNVNGTGTVASFSSPSAVAISSSSLLYVGDFGNNLVRKIDVNTASVNTTAGNGAEGFTNGPEGMAQFNGAANIVFDSQGNLYVADEENNVIREISTTGTVTTLAGSGASGYKDGAAGTAMFNHPDGMVVDAGGNLYVVDGANNVIRKIVLSTGLVSTYAGTGAAGFANGPVATATFHNPYGLGIDGSGNMYVADINNNSIRKITVSSGMVSTYCGTGAIGFANGAAAAATFHYPIACAFDLSGNMYVSDLFNNVMRKVATDGTVSTYAGSGSQGVANGETSVASFYHPIGLTVDAKGNLYVADEYNNDMRKIAVTQQ